MLVVVRRLVEAPAVLRLVGEGASEIWGANLLLFACGGFVELLTTEILPDVGVDVELRLVGFGVRANGASGMGLDVVEDGAAMLADDVDRALDAEVASLGGALLGKSELDLGVGHLEGDVLEPSPVEEHLLERGLFDIGR